MERMFYPAVDPLGFLVDDEIRPFELDERHDLTGTGTQACPIVSTGLFIVHEHRVPAKTVEVVHNVFPHGWKRNNPGTAEETIVRMTQAELEGMVLFDTSKDNNQPFVVENNYNIPSIATTPNDKNRTKLRGTSLFSSDAPMMSGLNMRNPYRTFVAPANSVVRVLFRLAPQKTAPAGGGTGIPNPLLIGSGTNRIDFAGALVVGVRMPSELYNKLKIARRRGQLGPEGNSADAPIGGQGTEDES